MSKIDRQICQNFYHVSKKNFWRIFFQKFLFPSLGIERFLSVESLLVPLSVLVSICQLDRIVVKKPLSTISFSRQFWTLIANWSVMVRFFLGQVDDTAFYESKGSICGHKTVLKSFCLFHLSIADLEQKQQGFFPENKLQGCQNCLPRVQGDLLKIFFWKKFFFLFHHWALSEFFFVISTNSCWSDCQYCFLFLNCTSLWWKFFFVKNFFLASFLDIDRKFIGLCSKFFWHSWRNCFPRVRRINLRTNICFGKLL